MMEMTHCADQYIIIVVSAAVFSQLRHSEPSENKFPSSLHLLILAF